MHVYWFGRFKYDLLISIWYGWFFLYWLIIFTFLLHSCRSCPHACHILLREEWEWIGRLSICEIQIWNCGQSSTMRDPVSSFWQVDGNLLVKRIKFKLEMSVFLVLRVRVYMVFRLSESEEARVGSSLTLYKFTTILWRTLRIVYLYLWTLRPEFSQSSHVFYL